ncbi:MAG: hypothetical protein M3P87_08750 [Actinomycetota bacterium]|nr:hypothetical protein [Actinomycetota bacterium]
MKDRTRMIIIGTAVAASAAVPVIASAAGNNAGGGGDNSDARQAASLAIPKIAVASSNNDIAGEVESRDATEDATEVDVPITGTDLEKAKAAALAQVGEGRVTATEVGDEESYYEVEITLDDGRQLDIQLDEQFNFVGSEGSGSDD